MTTSRQPTPASAEVVEAREALGESITVHEGRGKGYVEIDLATAKTLYATLTTPLARVDREGLVEIVRHQVINAPETADFMAGVPIEAAHQRDRWGSDHDAGKGPMDWFWLIGYLAQKAATAQIAGDADKALHHTIRTAAALANWHAAISGASTTMRPGIECPAAISAPTKENQQ